ncbi:TetR/AcrR family transcriptional regulator [Streptomyces sp. URMC 129]|uniref:TetR/AcrR family transcriptional regulator n=1 Tax=Streptomyces sp. URMC 129 TaxID=3423407 RepID=UPI003F1A1E71
MSLPSPAPVATRVRILDAAEGLMRTIGLARTTTKAIAQAAGCSEAALYKHYGSKEEIFVRVLQERLPHIGPLLAELTEDPGDRGLAQCLAEIAEHAVEFYLSVGSISFSLFAEPALLRRHRAALREMNTGPEELLRALTAYLRGERARGRVSGGADPAATAALLLGACFQRAFLHCFWEEEPPTPLHEFAATLAETLLTGIRA